ncbi:hypothetical protein TNCV_891741 [Trichonephila clavipes]|nr:hypothetical protein TNCV_891741 [Trichonephila clavipes]
MITKTKLQQLKAYLLSLLNPHSKIITFRGTESNYNSETTCKNSGSRKNFERKSTSAEDLVNGGHKESVVAKC